MNTVIGILSVIFGYTLFPLGNVLQKMGVSWQKWKGEKDKAYYNNLTKWFIGLMLSYVIAIFPTAIASKHLPPHVVSAVSGWSIVVTIMLTHFLLKEKLFKSDLIYSALIVVCIFVIGILHRQTESFSVNNTILYIMYLAPFVLPILGSIKTSSSRVKAILFSGFSGICDGLTIVLLNIMVKEYGASLTSYATSIYLYMYIAIGISAAFSMQMAYRSGDMVVIAPLQTSLNIVYPVICSFFVMSTSINILQIISVIIIVASCFLILRKH